MEAFETTSMDIVAIPIFHNILKDIPYIFL